MTMIALLLCFTELTFQDAEKLMDEADAAFHGKDFDKAMEL